MDNILFVMSVIAIGLVAFYYPACEILQFIRKDRNLNEEVSKTPYRTQAVIDDTDDSTNKKENKKDFVMPKKMVVFAMLVPAMIWFSV